MKNALFTKLAQLDEETEQLLGSIEVLESDMLQNNGYGWSIIQVLSHLQMAEGASLMYMTKKLKAGDKMGKIKPVHRLRMNLTIAALKTSLKWRAPKPVSNPEGGMTLDESREKWKKIRTSLRQYVDDYPENLLDRAVYKHPMAGRQGLEAAIDSFIYHQRHHVHQIHRIRKHLAV